MEIINKVVYHHIDKQQILRGWYQVSPLSFPKFHTAQKKVFETLAQFVVFSERTEIYWIINFGDCRQRLSWSFARNDYS